MRRKIRVKRYVRKNGQSVRAHSRKIQLNHQVQREFDPRLREIAKEELGLTSGAYGRYDHRRYRDVSEPDMPSIGKIRYNPIEFFDAEGNFLSPKAEREFNETILHEELHHLDEHYYEGDIEGEHMGGEESIDWASGMVSGRIR